MSIRNKMNQEEDKDYYSNEPNKIQWDIFWANNEVNYHCTFSSTAFH